MNKLIFGLILLGCFLSCKRDYEETTNQDSNIERYDIVLRNGNLIDLESGEISKKHVFINQGRIVRIEDADEQIKFYGHEVYNIEDKYILPGFWDNHVHFRGGDTLIEVNKEFLKLFIANGITTVRDAGGDLGESVIEWREAINNGTLEGPTIFTAGPKIDGSKARWAGSLEVNSEEDILAAIDSLEQMNVDFVKLYDSTISGDDYLSAIREAEKRKLITSGHMPFSVTLNESVEAGLDGIEHLYYVLKGCSEKEKEITTSIKNGEIGFWESMSGLIETYSDSTANETFNLLKDNSVYVVPTLHIGNVLSYLDEEDHSQDEYLAYMTDAFIKTYEGRINSALNSSEEARNNRKALNSRFQKLANDLNDANVSLLAGSDCGAYNSYVYPGISLHKELEALVQAGLTPLEALKCSAYNGAKFLKHQTDYGKIEEGKIADIIVLDNNPLEDIRHSNSINAVIKRGRRVDLSNILKQ